MFTDFIIRYKQGLEEPFSVIYIEPKKPGVSLQAVNAIEVTGATLAACYRKLGPAGEKFIVNTLAQSAIKPSTLVKHSEER